MALNLRDLKTFGTRLMAVQWRVPDRQTAEIPNREALSNRLNAMAGRVRVA